jgi:hypothetical protein
MQKGIKTIRKIEKKGYTVSATTYGSVKVQRINKDTLAPVGYPIVYTSPTRALKHITGKS